MSTEDKDRAEFDTLWVNTLYAELDPIDRFPCFIGWKAAKESSRKELEEAKQEIVRLNAWADSFSDAQIKERQTGEMYQRELRAEKEALEKKLAEQQAIMQRLRETASETKSLLVASMHEKRSYEEYEAEINAINDVLLVADGTEELTKREAAAHQQGFEDGKQAGRDEEALSNALAQQTQYDLGKQAGRDELLNELRKQEPIAWMKSTHLSQLENKHCGSDSMFAKVSFRKLMSDYKPLYAEPKPAAQAIPEGWQLVPKEPTIEMREALRKHLGGSFLRTKDAYQAMIAEAQKT